MGMVHYTTNGRLTVCGLSTDYAIHADEAEGVSGCGECLDAAAAPAGCPGGCGVAAQDCSCVRAGWDAAVKAFFGDEDQV